MNNHVRFRLLVFLWILAAVTFTTIDLFRNVTVFDPIRPLARSYRALRVAAHEMVGEPYYDEAIVDSDQRPTPGAAARLSRELARTTEDDGFEGLLATAKSNADPRVRIRAFRTLAREHAAESTSSLNSIAWDEEETLKMRGQAARYLAWCGDVVGAAKFQEPRLRGWAERGLAELGTPAAAQILLERRSVEIGRIRNPAAIHVLTPAARNSAAACQALGGTRDGRAVPPLAAVAVDRSVDPTIRIAAVEALGHLSGHEARAAVAKASTDPWPRIVEAAKLAHQRLEATRRS